MQRLVWPEGEPEDPIAFPWMGLTPDQGSDIWSAQTYLRYSLQANIEILPDVSHGVWNDFRTSLKKAGLWTFILCMILTTNLGHSKFNEGKSFNIIKGGMEEYMTVGSSTDSIYQMLYPKILRDQSSFLSRAYQVMPTYNRCIP